MFPYSQAVNPSLRTHLESQAAFFNDYSKSLSTVIQNICSANLKLGQALLEETTVVGQRLLTTRDTTEALEVMASAAQPASNKLRAYQQNLSRLAAEAQVDMSRVTQQHAQETSRTARELVDGVARSAAQQAETSLRQQREAVEKATQPFSFDTKGERDGRNDATQDTSKGGSAGAQGHAQAGNASVHGSVEGQAPGTNQSGKKSS